MLKAREKRYVFRADIEGLVWYEELNYSRVVDLQSQKRDHLVFLSLYLGTMSRQRWLDLSVLDGVYGRRSGTEGPNYWGLYTQIEEF